MAISSAFKEKTVIIGDHDEHSAEQIKSVFVDQGFVDFQNAHDGDQVFEKIRQFSNRLDDVALVVINAELPRCYLEKMCNSLSSYQDGVTIPFIIADSEAENKFALPDLLKGSLTYILKRPFNAQDLLTRLEFIEAIKHERYLRHFQEEKLFNELAQRNLMDAKLKYLVIHDELTGLINRNEMEQQLKQALIAARKNLHDGALLYIDIDRFSLINELEGYDAGDHLIVEVVCLIRKIINDDSVFSRIGSDEFCLYLADNSGEQAQKVAEEIRFALDQHRFLIDTVPYQLSASIGIASIKNSRASLHPGELISKAHQACYMAKKNGRNKINEYRDDCRLIQERHRDVYWVPLIREAFLEEFFFLEYQPIINLRDGSITHYEALIRMQNKNKEISRPDEFIPAAERMGLIHSIDMWVINKAIDFLAALPSDQAKISLSINLSSYAFQDKNLSNTIKKKLEKTGVQAERVTFEITETAAVDNFDATREMITEIRALGCRFALDDFGAGYCSFNYLKKFPVDFIKIDGQFIQNLIEDETDRVLVRSMSEIARKLGKTTIAEYVECPEVVKLLVDMGINLGQGYLFGHPSKKLLDKEGFSMKEYLSKTKIMPDHFIPTVT